MYNRKIFENVLKILSKYNCKIIRNKELDTKKDIDIFCLKKEFPYLSNCLIKEGFKKRKINSYQYHFYKFKEKHFLFLDIITSYKYLSKYFKVNFKNNLSEKEILFFRYILELKNNEKSFKYISNNYKELEKNNFYQDKLSTPLFKKNPKIKDLKKILKRNLLVMSNYFKINFFLGYLINRTKEIFKVFNSGKIIAIIGPDGVGKTSIIDEISSALNCEKIYMGGKEFFFDQFYLKYQNNKFLKLIIFLMKYIENWIRFIIVRINKFKGKIVFIDRFPKWELITNSKEKKINKILHTIFYKYLFPAPDKIIILYLDAKEIHNRKNELSLKKINFMQNKIKVVFKGYKKAIFIENIDLNETLNKILKILY